MKGLNQLKMNKKILQGIDEPIRDLVRLLNENGYKTIASCCGHGKMPCNIALCDGREIVIMPNYETARKVENLMIENNLAKPINISEPDASDREHSKNLT